jgi:hypothetical protein
MSYQGEISNTVAETGNYFRELENNLLGDNTASITSNNTVTCEHEWEYPVTITSVLDDQFLPCDIGDEYFREYVHYRSTSLLAYWLETSGMLPEQWWPEGLIGDETEISAVRIWIAQHDATECHYCEESGLPEQDWKSFGTIGQKTVTEQDYSQHYCAKCGAERTHTSYEPVVDKDYDGSEMIFQVYRESDDSCVGEYRVTSKHACVECGYVTSHSSLNDGNDTMYCEDCDTYGYCDWESHTWESGYYVETARDKFSGYYCTKCSLFRVA